MVAKAAHTQVDLAQAVEEQEAGANRRMFELLLDELERRQRADLEQGAPSLAALELFAPFVGRQRRRLGLPAQDVLNDRDELVMPAP